MAESLPSTGKSVPTEKTYILQDVGNIDTNSTAAVESGTINKVCYDLLLIHINMIYICKLIVRAHVRVGRFLYNQVWKDLGKCARV